MVFFKLFTLWTFSLLILLRIVVAGEEEVGQNFPCSHDAAFAARGFYLCDAPNLAWLCAPSSAAPVWRDIRKIRTAQ
jgi:hypothetical protein